ncbi:MAG: methylated-DNA--[protein]-cysteine S-methyltransferase [Sandaracinaceae bacterium]
MPEQRTTEPGPNEGVKQGTLHDDVLGPLTVTYTDAGIVALSFGGDSGPLVKSLAEPLSRYLAGESIRLSSIPVSLVGTAFQQRVWTALRDVPRGHVRTYGGLAADVGSPRAMRAVGAAMGANPIPIVVPCHRIVAKGYELGGYSAGLERKRHLLTLEGVALDGDRVRPGQLTLV